MRNIKTENSLDGNDPSRNKALDQREISVVFEKTDTGKCFFITEVRQNGWRLT